MDDAISAITDARALEMLSLKTSSIELVKSHEKCGFHYLKLCQVFGTIVIWSFVNF